MVDRAGLENRSGCKPTVGSNPTLSAINQNNYNKIIALTFELGIWSTSGSTFVLGLPLLGARLRSRGVHPIRKTLTTPNPPGGYPPYPSGSLCRHKHTVLDEHFRFLWGIGGR